MEILLVDDETTIQLTIGDRLRQAGHNVTVTGDGLTASKLIREQAFDVVLTDIRLPKIDGRTLLTKVLEAQPETDVILMTAYANVGDAVEALKEGARDYLSKPFDVSELIVRLQYIEEKRRLREELREARVYLKNGTDTSSIIGESPSMRAVKHRIETIARSDAPVLITGESGTGKEMIARSLHKKSERSDGPFIAVNCAGLPDTLLESELFGHEKGAFTGADKRRKGRFEAAHNGTIFLDEIGELPSGSQTKLLRVLQEKTIERVGSHEPVPVNAWILSATNKDLPSLIEQGTFREDLYYRLMVLDILAPPLRERRSDLALLVEYFIRKHQPSNQERPEISPEAWAALSSYHFPGNVRELEHAIRHAIVLSNSKPIGLEHLPRQISNVGSASQMDSDQCVKLSDAIRSFEYEYIQRALRMTNGKKAQAAELLGISRKNLWEKLKSHETSSAEYSTT
ncbi:MAG: sigma-54-dependent Fis family transcriptional regulator [Deltaproteobacteria bacterium]|jgi:two-component system, NtrC family, response regulator AtoC|nr:sigma-54-dependent Fis family transcriptional regulator [Deltaproteobacteria bacterium]MBT6491875.1 sigma-54-dependent Fis family transcriptional regulator [Deltaproteobacteria bacterium]